MVDVGTPNGLNKQKSKELNIKKRLKATNRIKQVVSEQYGKSHQTTTYFQVAKDFTEENMHIYLVVSTHLKNISQTG